ncbi:MAG: GNAT family N-acetyltransferase [Anaerolineaceae bacterium]|nr:GNAT family N-acetyltransferase [Anaerolineaceae bacterium]
MNVKAFKSPNDFLDAVQDYLEVQEALNSLMLGLAFRLSQSAPRRRNRPFLAVVEDGGEVVGAAVMTPPRKLILYSHLADCQPMVRALWSALQGSRWTVPGVLGPAEAADAWAKLWEMENGRSPQPGMRQRVFELRQVRPLALPPGHLRLANADDFAQMVTWVKGFHEDAHLREELDALELLTRSKIVNDELFLWESEAGEVVTMAAKTRPTRHGIAVSLVYTPAEHRGCGYATACVATLSQQLLDDGYQFCTLFTDLSNPVSNHIYEKIGYTAVADFHEYYFD